MEFLEVKQIQIFRSTLRKVIYFRFIDTSHEHTSHAHLLKDVLEVYNGKRRICRNVTWCIHTYVYIIAYRYISRGFIYVFLCMLSSVFATKTFSGYRRNSDKRLYSTHTHFILQCRQSATYCWGNFTCKTKTTFLVRAAWLSGHCAFVFCFSPPRCTFVSFEIFSFFPVHIVLFRSEEMHLFQLLASLKSKPVFFFYYNSVPGSL